jgi:hypothetical protein
VPVTGRAIFLEVARSYGRFGSSTFMSFRTPSEIGIDPFGLVGQLAPASPAAELAGFHRATACR